MDGSVSYALADVLNVAMAVAAVRHGNTSVCYIRIYKKAEKRSKANPLLSSEKNTVDYILVGIG